MQARPSSPSIGFLVIVVAIVAVAAVATFSVSTGSQTSTMTTHPLVVGGQAPVKISVVTRVTPSTVSAGQTVSVTVTVSARGPIVILVTNPSGTQVESASPSEDCFATGTGSGVLCELSYQFVAGGTADWIQGTYVVAGVIPGAPSSQVAYENATFAYQ